MRILADLEKQDREGFRWVFDPSCFSLRSVWERNRSPSTLFGYSSHRLSEGRLVRLEIVGRNLDSKSEIRHKSNFSADYIVYYSN